MSFSSAGHRVTLGVVALATAALLLSGACSAPDEVVFEGGVPEQSATTATTSVTTTALREADDPPETTSTSVATTTTEGTTTSTRVAVTSGVTDTTTAATPSLSELRTERLTGQVVVNGPRTDSVTILGPGSERTEVFAAPGEFVSQPTWSPDGRFVAWSRTTPEGHSVVISPATGDRGTSYETPFSVFYMQWRPDGGALGLLGSPGAGRVALVILDLDGGTVTSVNESSSYYFHWSPEGDRLLTHLDSADLDLLDPLTGDVSPLDAVEPARSDYLAPVWTPDGRSVLYVRTAAEDRQEAPDELVIHDLETGDVQVLAAGSGFFSFAASPDGGSVAYSIQNLGAATAMRVIDLATGRTDRIDAPGNFAFQWSPDSRKILLLGIGAEQMTLGVYESGRITRYRGFLPTDNFLQSYLAFWSQYDLSHSLWAPDSSAFVYAAFDQNSNQVFLQPLDENAPIPLGAGSMAVFSPSSEAGVTASS